MYSERFRIYKADVVRIFLDIREKGGESWLIRLTRFQIRDKIIKLIEDGVEANDHRAISDFLEMKSEDRDYLSAIKKTEGDYFKGFSKFLKTPTINPSEDTVELLAWLIRFPNRPYSVYIEVNGLKGQESETPMVDVDAGRPTEVEEQEISNVDTEVSFVPELKDESVQYPETGAPATSTEVYTDKLSKEPKDYSKLWIIGAGMTMLLAVLIWGFWPKDDCMYWSNDHYVESPCGVPKLDTPLIALDRAKLRGFRRINADTITSYAVDRFWYYRYPGTDSVEVYTARGVNPMHPDKTLKIVKDYIVNVCQNKHRGN